MLASSIISIVIEKYDEKYQNLFSERMSKRVMELDFQHTEDKKALDQINLAREGMSWYSGGVVGIFQQVFTAVTQAVIIIGVMAIILTKAALAVFDYSSTSCNKRFHTKQAKQDRY